MAPTTLGILLVLASALLESFGQIFLKKSMFGGTRWFLWITTGIIALSIEALLYTEALKLLDVGVAFPLMSLNLISVTLLSQWVLRERVTRTRWVGVCLIFAGAGLVMAHATG
jgi:undecaprenyl phosphate-alpha-L-ara4N flippase subunit ArnE